MRTNLGCAYSAAVQADWTSTAILARWSGGQCWERTQGPLAQRFGHISTCSALTLRWQKPWGQASARSVLIYCKEPIQTNTEEEEGPGKHQPGKYQERQERRTSQPGRPCTPAMRKAGPKCSSAKARSRPPRGATSHHCHFKQGGRMGGP